MTRKRCGERKMLGATKLEKSNPGRRDDDDDDETLSCVVCSSSHSAVYPVPHHNIPWKPLVTKTRLGSA